MRSAGRRQRHGSGTAGFLLSETLATFVISAFVLVSLASVAQVLMHAIDVSVARVQDADGLGRTMDALSRDVSGLSRARWSGDEPQPFVFRGGPNSLYFVHRAQSSAGALELHVIALREVATALGPKLVRSEARLPPTARSFDGLRFVSPRQLDTASARLRFSYVGPPPKPPQGAAPTSRPMPAQTSWPMGVLLPDAVIIEAVDATSKKVIVSARVAIRATADIGCIPKDLPAPPAPAAGAASTAVTSPVVAPPMPVMAAPIAPPPGGSPGPFCGRPDAKDDAASSPAGAQL